MSEHTARRFMVVAREYGEKSRIVRDLEPTALYELAAPKTPPEVREEIERMIEAGEVVTKATVARLRADKAAALASYARQAEDVELERKAARIRARAMRRAGELLQQFDGRGGDRTKNDAAVISAPSQKEVADKAGMSDRQRVTAIRIANIPKRDFDTTALTFSPLR